MLAPENTLAAFDLAIRLGCDAIELDAKLSADGIVVVIHDQTVDRTTDGTGKVSELTLSSLKELDAGSFFDHQFRDESIPTLEEVFEVVGRKTFINIELTNYASLTDRLPETVVSLVKMHALEDRVFFSSFNPLALRKTRRLLPNIPVGLLAFPGRQGWIARSWLGKLLVKYEAIHPEVGDIDQPFMQRFQKRHIRVFTYTVNDPEILKRLYQLNIDGVFTDDPVMARSILEQSSAVST